MALIRLRGPLKQRAGGSSDHAVAAGTVREALRALEREQPELHGWILDERGRVRRHINVFVNGEAGDEETALGGDDCIDVLPAISGGLA
jgi:molybdopterin synthase sulfur carrier subunit